MAGKACVSHFYQLSHYSQFEIRVRWLNKINQSDTFEIRVVVGRGSILIRCKGGREREREREESGMKNSKIY